MEAAYRQHAQRSEYEKSIKHEGKEMKECPLMESLEVKHEPVNNVTGLKLK